jgi:pimeloyl-ACP methyl ester carboxylesterase
MTPEMMPVEVAGYRIAASRWPSGGAERTIVLLHAGVCDRRSWYSTAEHLADLGTVLAYDRRGFGESPVSPDSYRDLDDLWAVVGQVTDGPVWLVGSSMGGLLAVDAAVTSPERVAGLVLLAPAISGAPEDDEKLDPQSTALFEQLQAARKADDQAQRLQLHTRIWLDGPAATAERVTGPARELALTMNETILRNDVDDEAGASGVNAWSQLEEIRTPTTVAWGDLDVPLLIEESEVLATRLPNARTRVLPDTAHLPYLEQPTLVADVIRAAVTG